MNPAAPSDSPPRRSSTSPARRWPAGFVALALASAVWLPNVHWLFVRPPATYLATSTADIAPQPRALAERQLTLWTDPALKARELTRMRGRNAEWDFMGRSFLVWSLAEISLRAPATAARNLAVADEIIDETLRLERDQGQTVFLLPYATRRPWVARPARSLFVDGEIALMLAMRRMAGDKPDYRAPLAERVDAIVARLQANPLLISESYPDECWLFDHAVALAAIRLADHLDGTDHSAFLRDWLDHARRRLIDPRTGLLVSSFSTAGDIGDGPEGSSIWAALHFLRLVDDDFARAQYALARRELARGLGGFAWSREWPRSANAGEAALDIDSGMIIPGLDISAGGSGMAFIGASSFGDSDYLGRLHATLDFAAFPLREGGGLRYCASNLVGDAVMLYAGVLGPVWNRVLPAPTTPRLSTTSL
jgi:hypothetical protein